jgi:hypothetical protein
MRGSITIRATSTSQGDLHELIICCHNHIGWITLGTTVLASHRADDHVVVEILQTTTQVRAFGVQAFLRTSVVALAFVNVDTIKWIVGIGLESITAMTIISIFNISAEVFAAAVIVVRVTCLAVLLCAANLVTGVAAVIIPITCKSGVDAMPIGALELIRAAVAIFREGRAHAEVLIRKVVVATIVEPVAQLEYVQAEP